MGKRVDDHISVSVHSVGGTWTPTHSRTWRNDIVDGNSRSRSWAWTWGFRNRLSSADRTTSQAVTAATRSAERTMPLVFSAIWSFICHSLWPMVIQIFTAKKQWTALFLFLSCAVVPMVVLGYFTPEPSFAFGTWPPFYNVFATKTMSCDNRDIDYYPVNSTITGIEGLFVLDQTWGRFAFSTVKTIDAAWDIVFGRGVQLLAWWAAYIVFSDALLRVIERHPASFRIFQRIALEGPSLLSLWTLCKEVLSIKSKRTKLLFTYMLLSTSYVLCIPVFLGAMTGYDSTAIAWIDIDNSNDIVPASAMKPAWVITGTRNSTFDHKVCSDPGNADIQSQYFSPRVDHCSCQMPNGTMAPPGTFRYYESFALSVSTSSPLEEGISCMFNYHGSDGTWDATESEQNASPKEVIYNCNETVTLRVNEQTYDIQNLNGTLALCYNNEAYDHWALQGKSRCLPDTANPSYQWGFSTMLSGIFVFIHFGWCVSMYILWLDAQSKSTLINEGYKMTPLRAAFAIVKAVKHKTGLEEEQLVRHNTRALNKEIYGFGKEKGTNVEYSIFVANAEEDVKDGKATRRRRVLA
ncbi:uncharacterized protein EKO05_0003049 [Ascochyta rabiei]|uniref:uncharacterized protein n=1 Tax=Didymella rabiei TaxID=5454 RepID=UPI00220BE975|nr:uncharacterized protein EKO05_0003049 [Ascochyta rabiei]UPX12504.1 hypothetical protein EKO05_0003049 [Ascochyta rabiei]